MNLAQHRASPASVPPSASSPFYDTLLNLSADGQYSMKNARHPIDVVGGVCLLYTSISFDIYTGLSFGATRDLHRSSVHFGSTQTICSSVMFCCRVAAWDFDPNPNGLAVLSYCRTLEGAVQN